MNFKLGDVAKAQFIDLETGQVIGEIQTLQTPKLEYEPAVDHKTKFLSGWNGSGTLENASFNMDALKRLFEPERDPTFTIKAKNKTLDRLKYLHKKTKNRRIKRKLQKRIRKMDHRIYNEGITLKRSQIHFTKVNKSGIS